MTINAPCSVSSAARSIAPFAPALFRLENSEKRPEPLFRISWSSLAFFCSVNTSTHPWKHCCTSPVSVACDIRLRTADAPAFCFFMNSASFASSFFTASSNSRFLLYSAINCTQACKHISSKPASEPAFIRDNTFLDFAACSLLNVAIFALSSAISRSCASLSFLTWISATNASKHVCSNSWMLLPCFLLIMFFMMEVCDNM
mmetsp:Transcript_120355/g.188810  ORF Transcript_120355/g.188810 Transcript_120355/m.188810 type:complete len:202 (-) Transcript_120355:550-1155(-)